MPDDQPGLLDPRNIVVYVFIAALLALMYVIVALNGRVETLTESVERNTAASTTLAEKIDGLDVQVGDATKNVDAIVYTPPIMFVLTRKPTLVDGRWTANVFLMDSETNQLSQLVVPLSGEADDSLIATLADVVADTVPKYERLRPMDVSPDDPLAGAWRACTYTLIEPPADAAEILSDALGVPLEPLEDVIKLPDSMDGLRRFMRHSSLLDGPGEAEAR